MKKVIAGVGGGVVTLIVGAAVVVLIFVLVVSSIISGLGAVSGMAAKQFKMDQASNQCLMGGSGQFVPTTMTQVGYVRTMIGVAKGLKVPEKGQVVAAMVMLQETGIHNHANNGQNSSQNHRGWPPPGEKYWLDMAKLSLQMPYESGFIGSDSDSVGLYQQRASMGWSNDATFKAQDNPEEAIRRLLSPVWTTAQFFGGPGGSPNRGLLEIAGWESMAPTVAAQKVQGSAFPSAYAKWEAQAMKLVQANKDAPAINPYSASAGASPQPASWTEPTLPKETLDPGALRVQAAAYQAVPQAPEPTPSTSAAPSSQVVWPMREGTYTFTSGFGPRASPGGIGSTNHEGADFAGPIGTPIYAIAEGTVTHAGPSSYGVGVYVSIDHVIDGKKIGSLYGHMPNGGPKVQAGQKVKAGQQIGVVGNSGNSTGPHLHFGLWLGSVFRGQAFDPMPFLRGNHAVSPAPGGVSTVGADCGDGGGDPGVATGTAAEVIAAGKKWLGTPYSWGGGTINGPSKGILSEGNDGRNVVGFDCSSLVQNMVYNGTGRGLLLPRTATAQYKATKAHKVTFEQLQPGDLMFWGTENLTHHMAMYIGGGKIISENRPGGEAGIRPAYKGNDFLTGTRLKFTSSAGASSSSSSKASAAAFTPFGGVGAPVADRTRKVSVAA